MKKFTQLDFEGFEVDEYGRRICPSGDYTEIKSFGEGCSFGEKCSFGEGCSFGEECSFGEGCSFGEWCSFGEGCSFGERCSFGEGCSFGEWCSFGKWCSFEKKAVKNGRYVAIDKIGSAQRKAYFFIDGSGQMFVRAGCWFSTMEKFKERVKDVHSGTIHEKTYLMACDLAEVMLKGSNE